MARRMTLFHKIILGVAVAVGGWATFNLISKLLEGAMVKIGITSEIGQAATLVILVFLVLLMLGLGFKSALLKLFK